jgi:hypothetical protein
VPELSQPAVRAALLLSLVRFALMFQGQRDKHGMDAVIGGPVMCPELVCVAALVSLGAGVWTLRSFMWEDLTVL